MLLLSKDKKSSCVYNPPQFKVVNARITYHGVPVKAAFPVCGGKYVQASRFM